MCSPDRPRASTHDETAADVADSASTTGEPSVPVRRFATRTFWWLAHHVVARPLVIVFPVRYMFRFSVWTLNRRNM